MIRRFLTVALGLVLTSTLWVSQASAGPVGSVEWNNSTFEVELVSSVGGQYTFELRADLTNFSQIDQTGHFDYLIGVNFKPSNGTVVGIVGTPITDAGGSWTYNVDAALNSGGGTDCKQPGNNEFFCGVLLDVSDWASNPAAGNTYTWQFTLQITGVTDEDALVSGTPVRALFAEYHYRRNGGGDWQTSLASLTTGTSVPEPSSFSLLGFGVAALGSSIIRQRKSRRRLPDTT
jgi:PEP-CTERM motif